MNPKALLKSIPLLLTLTACSPDPSQVGPEVETGPREVRTKTTDGPSGSVLVYLASDEAELKLPTSLSVTLENPSATGQNLRMKHLDALNRRFIGTKSTERYSFGCNGQSNVEIPSTIDADSVEFCGAVHLPPGNFKVRANQVIMTNASFSMNVRDPRDYNPELTTSIVEFHARKLTLGGSNQITAIGASSEKQRRIAPMILLRIVNYEGAGNLEVYSLKSFRTWEY